MRGFRSFFSFYFIALRLAFNHFRAGNLHRALYLSIRPIDYWRVFEFVVSAEQLNARSGERILDIGSPKVFPLHQALHKKAHIITTDIYDDMGLTDCVVFKTKNHLTNLEVITCDVRALAFPDQSIDKVISISVLEHVYPEEGGDVLAFKEIGRILKDDGIAVVTLPFGKKAKTQYLKKRVYERRQTAPDEMVFYQRRYDESSIQRLLATLDEFVVEKLEFVCERYFHKDGRELCNIISEGNKAKRLFLAPLYPVFAAVFLTRSHYPLPESDYMAICLCLRRKQRSSMS